MYNYNSILLALIVNGLRSNRDSMENEESTCFEAECFIGSIQVVQQGPSRHQPFPLGLYTISRTLIWNKPGNFVRFGESPAPER